MASIDQKDLQETFGELQNYLMPATTTECGLFCTRI